VGTGGTAAEVEMVAMRMRVIVVRLSRHWSIDVAAISVLMRMIVVGLVSMRMAMHRAIGMDMFVSMLIFVLIFVMVRRAIDPCFASAATASRTHFHTPRFANPSRLRVP
jgi:hypothetical protein